MYTCSVEWLEKVKLCAIWVSALLPAPSSAKDIHHSAQGNLWTMDSDQGTMNTISINRDQDQIPNRHRTSNWQKWFLEKGSFSGWERHWESTVINQSIKARTCNAFERSFGSRKSAPGSREPFISVSYYFYANASPAAETEWKMFLQEICC